MLCGHSMIPAIQESQKEEASETTSARLWPNLKPPKTVVFKRRRYCRFLQLWSHSDSQYAIITMAKLVVFEDSRYSLSHAFLRVSFHSLHLSKLEEQIQLREFLFLLISKGDFLFVLSSVVLPPDIILSLGCFCSRFFFLATY